MLILVKLLAKYVIRDFISLGSLYMKHSVSESKLFQSHSTVEIPRLGVKNGRAVPY